MDVSTALKTIAADAERGEIVFPTHCEIALRVQRMLDDADCATDTLVRLISAEPILTTRVLSLANSIAYNPGGRVIHDLKSAIARLGFSALRAIAAAIIVRQMQAMPQLPEHRALASRLWEHTASVASLARLIARRVTQQNPDAAFFAGIVHEIGNFYLISRASAFPGLLNSDLEIWHGEGEASVGRAVLHALDTPAHIADAMETVWSGFLSMPPKTLGDTLLLADEITPVESPIDTLTGMSRKGMNTELELLIDDETLSSILEESTSEVAALCAVLNAE